MFNGSIITNSSSIIKFLKESSVGYQIISVNILRFYQNKIGEIIMYPTAK